MTITKQYPSGFRAWRNRNFLGFKFRSKGKGFQIVVPIRHRRGVKAIKYILAAVGLLSSLVAFQSIISSFFVALVIFILSGLIEKFVFAHPAMFVHALPAFDLAPEKWLGVSFGRMTPECSGENIPLVGMVVEELDYAHKMAGLLLNWTRGEVNDRKKNIRISIVELTSSQYLFLCFPSPDREIAEEALEESRKEVRKASLEDEVLGLQTMLVLGKHCPVSSNSYYPQFKQEYQPGSPVLFHFMVPPLGEFKRGPEMPELIIHDFSFKSIDDLTPKDMEYGITELFYDGGEYSGPMEIDLE